MHISTILYTIVHNDSNLVKRYERREGTKKCALIGWAWVVIANLDPLSAYLATTPGGIDVVTIAALDTGAALAVIVPVQMLWLLVMVLAGPLVVRWLHRHVPTYAT